jgi:starch synthase (maltosyl-transferring)
VARTPEPSGVLTTAVAGLRDTHLRAEVRLAAGITQAVQREMAERPLRDFVTPSPEYPWLVEGERALYGAWYEVFPRSEAATLDEATGLWTSSHLRHRRPTAPRDRGDGFRRRLPHAGSSDRPDEPQGAQQHPAGR